MAFHVSAYIYIYIYIYIYVIPYWIIRLILIKEGLDQNYISLFKRPLKVMKLSYTNKNKNKNKNKNEIKINRLKINLFQTTTFLMSSNI